MLRLYIDDSKDDRETAVVAAGYLASDEQWEGAGLSHDGF